MIKTAHSPADIAQSLSEDFILDKQPFKTYAGFETGSSYEGTARQTFSLVLSTASIGRIRSNIKQLYDQLLRACWPKNKILPFDMIRFDAFFDPTNDSVKIIELNTRNVGMHEIVEWLDEVTASRFSVTPGRSLNKTLVINQKLLHSSELGNDVPLLYMTKPMIPKWKYYDELMAAYSSVCHVTSPSEYKITPAGLRVRGVIYHAISRKFSWPLGSQLTELSQAGVISIMQPLWMRPFGRKDYLPKLKDPSILHSENFMLTEIDSYMARKDTLVLKIVNSGGSKSVYLGPLCTIEQWQIHLQEAAEAPELWIIQEYYAPPASNIIVHGCGSRRVPIQLGIFVLPKPSAPADFTMDIVVKGYGGTDHYFTFDPSGLNPDIWFGNVIEH